MSPESLSAHDGTGELGGRVVLVTGAASGFGRVLSRAFLRAGARVALTDANARGLENMASELAPFAGRCACIVADLRNLPELVRLVEEAHNRLGGVDILVNNAGISPGYVRADYVQNPVRFWEHSNAQTAAFFAVNSVAPAILAARLAPAMVARSWGRIINVTTSMGSMLRGGMAGYGNSKAATEALTAIIAADLVETGVTANVLIPGGASNTPMVPENAGLERAALIQPEAMIAPALWLASAAADQVTGRRFIAALWDQSLPTDHAAAFAGAPAGWPSLGEQTIYPAGYRQKS